MRLIKGLIVICLMSMRGILSSMIPYELMNTYFELNNIGQENYFICEPDVKDLAKSLLFNKGSGRLSLKNVKKLTGHESTDLIKSSSHEGRLGVFLDLRCDEGLVFLKKCSDEYLFTGGFSWLLWNTSYSSTINILDDINISLDTEATLVVPGFHLYDLYKIHYSLKTISTRIASWSRDEGYTQERQRPPRNNFQGFTLTIAITMPVLPFNENSKLEDYVDPRYEPEIDGVCREFLAVFSHLKDMLNLTNRYRFYDDWGYEVSPGNFSGSIGSVIRGESEYGVTIFKMREDRYQFVDFLFTTKKVKMVYSFLQPNSFGSFKALSDPLSGEVWMYLGLLMLLFILTYRLLARFDPSPDINSWGAIIVYAIGAVAQQGFEDTVKRTSGRIVSFCLLVMSYMVFTYYNASVLNALLSPSPNTIFTMQQLLDSGMEFGLLDIGYNRDRKSNESIFGGRDAERDRLYKIFDKMPKLYYQQNEALDKIRKGGFVLHSTPDEFYPKMMSTYTDAEICSYYIINKIPPFPVAPVIRKDSPYTEILRQSMIAMGEAGLQDRSKDEWFIQKPPCQWRLDSTSIGPESLSMAYVVLSVGILASLVIFAFELISHRVLNKGIVPNNPNKSWTAVKNVVVPKRNVRVITIRF